MILPLRSRAPRRLHRDVYAEAVVAGIDPVVAETTPTPTLEVLIAAAPHLRLVPNVEAIEWDDPDAYAAESIVDAAREAAARMCGVEDDPVAFGYSPHGGGAA